MSFQAILRVYAALADYSKQAGLNIATHSLAEGFRSCSSLDDSLDDALKLLAENIQLFICSSSCIHHLSELKDHLSFFFFFLKNLYSSYNS